MAKKKISPILQAYIDWYTKEFGFPPKGATTNDKALTAKTATESSQSSFNSWNAYKTDHQISAVTPQGQQDPDAVKAKIAQQDQTAAAKALAATPVTAAAPTPPPSTATTLDPFGGVTDAYGKPNDPNGKYSVVSSYANFAANGPGDDAIQHKVAGPAYQNAPDYAKQHLSSLDEAQIRLLQTQLVDANYLNNGHVTGLMDAETFKAYTNLLTDTSLANSAGNIITPDDYLAKVAKETKKTSQSHTSTSKSVNITSPDDARSLALQTFRQSLGRAPKAHELAAFEAALQSYDRSHPSVTTTNATTDAAGNATSSSSSTTGGGNDPQFAQDYVAAQDKPEQQAYAAGTSYFQAALDVLKAGGGGFTSDSIANAHAGG